MLPIYLVKNIVCISNYVCPWIRLNAKLYKSYQQLIRNEIIFIFEYNGHKKIILFCYFMSYRSITTYAFFFFFCWVWYSVLSVYSVSQSISRSGGRSARANLGSSAKLFSYTLVSMSVSCVVVHRKLVSRVTTIFILLVL